MSALLGGAGGALSGAAAGSTLGLPGAIAGGVLGALGGLFGNSVDEAAIQARKDAELESARRQALGQDIAFSEGVARAAASGTEFAPGPRGTSAPDAAAGSMQTYLATMATDSGARTTGT